MRAIVISEGNREKIAELLRSVNGRATKWTVTVDDVFQIARAAESRLESDGLPNRLRVGATASYRPAGPNSKSYGKYSVVTTFIRLRRSTTGWSLVFAETQDVWPKTEAVYRVSMTEESLAEAADIIRRRFTARYGVVYATKAPAVVASATPMQSMAA